MNKTVIMTSALNRTQAVIDNYVVVDMRHCLFTDGLPHGAILINQRHDGQLYANRLLGNRLYGIDGDEDATSAFIRGVEAIMGHEAEQWLVDNAPQNCRQYLRREFQETIGTLEDYAATPGVDRPLFLEERKQKPQKDIAAKSRSALSKLYDNQ